MRYNGGYKNAMINWEGYLLKECAPVLEYVITEGEHLEKLNFDKKELLYMINDYAIYNFGEWIVEYIDNLDEIIKRLGLKFEVIK